MLSGIRSTDHAVAVPLDQSRPHGEQVDTKQSLVTATAIRGLDVHRSDVHEHDGLVTGGTAVLDRLFHTARAAR